MKEGCIGPIRSTTLGIRNRGNTPKEILNTEQAKIMTMCFGGLLGFFCFLFLVVLTAKATPLQVTADNLSRLGLPGGHNYCQIHFVLHSAQHS